MKEYEAVLKIFLCWISICGNYHFISRHGNNKVSFASVLWELIISISTRPSFVLHPATSRMLLKSYWEFAHLVNIPSVQMYFHEEYAWTESLSRTQHLILHGDPPHNSAPWIPLTFQKKKKKKIPRLTEKWIADRVWCYPSLFYRPHLQSSISLKHLDINLP